MERALLLVAAAALVGLVFFLAALVIPKQETVWRQFAIVVAVVALTGFGFFPFVAAAMAP